MIIKTSELTGAALDWAVCEATGMFKAYTQFRSGKNFLKVYGVARNKHLHPSTDWTQGGPIIERERINLEPFKNINGEQWSADGEWDSPTPLVAAMRCYVASKLGDEVDVPEELTK
jgi:hypothetical protein